MTRANTKHSKHTPWFAKAGAACSIVPIARFVGPSVFALKGGGYGCLFSLTAYRAVRTRAKLLGGETVVVVGIGGVGRSTVEIATAFGGQVIAIDLKPSAREAAKKLGALEVIDPTGLTPEQIGERIRAINGGKGVEVSIDAVGGSQSTLAAFESVAKGGRVVIAGLTSQEDKGLATIPIDRLCLQELSIVGTLGNPHSDYPELLSLVQNGRLSPSRHIEEEVTLEDVQSVFDRMPSFQANGFVIVTKF